MSLLSNKLISHIILSILILIFQINFPSIMFFGNYPINLNLFLIYFTFLSLMTGSYKFIFCAFLYGLILDTIISVDQIGLSSFIMSLSVFFLLAIKNYENLWSLKMKYFNIFLIYFFHFLFYYLILYVDVFSITLLVSFFQTFFSFSLFLLISNFFIRIK